MLVLVLCVVDVGVCVGCILSMERVFRRRLIMVLRWVLSEICQIGVSVNHCWCANHSSARVIGIVGILATVVLV